MKCFQKVCTILFFLTMLSLAYSSIQKAEKDRNNVRVNCRKYVYAPVCRGVAAKRALPSAKSIRVPRGEPTYLDIDTPIQWKDKDKDADDNGMLRILFEKLEPKVVDYDNRNMENYLN